VDILRKVGSVTRQKAGLVPDSGGLEVGLELRVGSRQNRPAVWKGRRSLHPPLSASGNPARISATTHVGPPLVNLGERVSTGTKGHVAGNDHEFGATDVVQAADEI
jgi:hypothetical protein